MEKVLNLYKALGKTPLQMLERFQATYPQYAKEKMTYAGRLDPMAEGVLVALVGDETKNREAYTALNKEYVFEWVFGLETDTYDLLGLAEKLAETFVEPDENKIKKYIDNAKAKIVQTYPPFSSKVVDGKSLFARAKSGSLRKEDLPTHEVEIFKSEYIESRVLDRQGLEDFIERVISSVVGDFRQKQILADWKNRLSKSERGDFKVHKARIVVSSGFYVRQFVSDMGKYFGTGAVTFSILRTKVGTHEVAASTHLH